MFSRRNFLVRAAMAAAAIITGCGFTFGVEPLKRVLPPLNIDRIDRLYRWDGLLSAKPSIIHWIDQLPGDIVSPDGKEMWQVADLPHYLFSISLGSSVRCSKTWIRS